MRIPTLQRYLARQIWAAIAFVLVGFLALFAFFDLIAELRDLGTGNYALRQIVTVVVLGLPAHAYELLPVAVLIGTLYVLAHLSSNAQDLERFRADLHRRVSCLRVHAQHVAAVLPDAEQPVQAVELVEGLLEGSQRAWLVIRPGGEVNLRAHAHARTFDDYVTGA